MISCPHCGKDNKDGTSFCRACGKPTGALNQQPAMPTRVLDPGTMPVPMASETRPVSPPLPNPNAPPPPVQYVPVAAVPQKRKRRIWPVLLVSFLVIITVIIVAGVMLVRKAAVAAENFKEEIKKEIPVPDTVIPSSDVIKTYLGDLYYPGATPLPGLSQGENKLIKLQTSDPIDKVADYYKSKLTNMIPMAQEAGSFAFFFQKDEKMQGVITGRSENGTTEILLAIGTDIPKVPSIPNYPKPSRKR